MNAIPILLYHGITETPSARTAEFAVKPDDFARHMDVIVEREFRCLTISQLADELREPHTTHDTKTVCVTFDDGYADFAKTALAALTARSIPATLYVTSGWLQGGTGETTARPDDEMLDWSQLPDLMESSIEIGAHSHTHPQMDTLDSTATISELSHSKALIEDAISTSVRSFAYPHGYNSTRIRRLTVETGYDSAVAVRNALSHRNDDIFRLARLTVTSKTSEETVAHWLEGADAPFASANENFTTKGWRTFRRTKALLSGKPGTDYK